MLFKQTFTVPKPSYYVEAVSAFILSTWEAEMEISLVCRASSMVAQRHIVRPCLEKHNNHQRPLSFMYGRQSMHVSMCVFVVSPLCVPVNF